MRSLLVALGLFASTALAADAAAKPKEKGLTCSTGRLFAGNPLHGEPQERPKEGTGLLEDPPLPHRQPVISGAQLITHSGQEIWRAALSDQKLHKVAGTEGGMALVTGPCAKARFANIAQVALAKDGSLFVSDQAANAVLKVTDPLGEKCAVARWAGAPKDAESGITPTRHPVTGNADGPGAKALFGTVTRIALDAKDNVYAYDEDNDSLRKIANDEAHTVTTLVKKLGEGSTRMVSLAFADGRLYAWGLDGSNLFLSAFDAEGKKTQVLKGRGDLFGGDSSSSLTPGGIVALGGALVVSLNRQLYRVSPGGEVAELAGDGDIRSDYEGDYDPKVPHPAAKLQLVARSRTTTAGLNVYLDVDAASHLYFSASFNNAYVLQLDCKP